MIDPNNTFAMIAAVAGVIALGFLSERTAIGRRLSGAVVVLILAAALANLNVLPASSPAYGVIWTVGVPLAVALYLLKADLFGIVREGGATVVAFVAGAVGVVAGALIGALIFDLGAQEAALAAVFSATYSGGSLNFAAVAEAVSFRDESLLAAAVAVDNVMGIGFFALLSVVGGAAAFRAFLPYRAEALSAAGPAAPTPGGAGAIDGAPVIALCLAAAICALGGAAADLAGLGSYKILFITLIAVAAATVGAPLMRRLEGAEALAAVLMYAFFVVLGAGADLGAMLAAPPAMIPFVLLIFACHIAATLVAARIFKLNYGEVVVASGACIGGPPIAIAYAVLFGWRALAGPAVGVGVLGYALGNFIGVAVFSILTG
ncbi:MAG: DUF819 family protein [Pseudomonadota bacterium]